jgi:glycosyltransferase involved in cell wall biosynthesis
MKVLLISSKFYPEYSGSGFRAENTYRRLNKKYNLEFDVICNSKIFYGNKKYKHQKVRIYRISHPFIVPKSKTLKYYVFQILNIVWHFFFTSIFLLRNHKKYSLLHTFGDTWTIGFATIYFSLLKKPIIRELCNDTKYPMYPVQIHSLITKVFRRSNTLIIAISKRLYEVAYVFKPNKIWLRNNPIDERKFNNYNKNKFELRKKLTPFNENDKVLSIIANIIPRKNQLFALEVLNKLPKEYKIVIAGPLKEENKNYLNKVKKYIKENRLSDRVFIKTKFIPDIENYMKLSDVFLFPSHSEGLGTPVLEAQACGTPVVSNLIFNITDLMIKKGKGGFVSKLDSEKWSNMVKKALDIKATTLKENAKEVLKKSSSELIDKKYFNYIIKLHEK